MMLPTPLLGRGGVVARVSRGPQPCWCNSVSSRSFDREQDHVIARAGRHELKTPEPNHGGAREWPSGKEWEIGEKHAGPLPGTPTVGVFPTGSHTNE